MRLCRSATSISFNSLPRAFETTRASIPCDVPYLPADPLRVADWARQLRGTHALRVGLVRAGQARPWRLGFVGLDRGLFADTAAIVAHLDLVISVDTSAVHLAAAMGKKVFLLDRYDNCWRWLSGREDSP
jgi:hypothetical protein